MAETESVTMVNPYFDTAAFCERAEFYTIKFRSTVTFFSTLTIKFLLAHKMPLCRNKA